MTRILAFVKMITISCTAALVICADLAPSFASEQDRESKTTSSQTEIKRPLGMADGAIEQVTAEDCAFYRRGGNMKTEDIVVYNGDNKILANGQRELGFYWTKIYYSEPYFNKVALNFKPMTRRPDGTYPPLNGGGFLIDIATGEPEKDGQNDYSRAGKLPRPQDYTHFSLRVSAHSYNRTPERTIGIYSRSRSFLSMVWEGYMDGGFFIHTKKPDYTRTGTRLYGFERIIIPDAEAYIGDFFILTDRNDEVASVLHCSLFQVYPNPDCRIEDQVGIFSMTAHFNRTQLADVNQIRHHARRFTACLTVPIP